MEQMNERDMDQRGRVNGESLSGGTWDISQLIKPFLEIGQSLSQGLFCFVVGVNQKYQKY